ncbi:MAG: hypothetical protein N2557_01965 [Hydrogenophilus sp.]|nr:hypothetical protein [Hydrogenophilus sp.]
MRGLLGGGIAGVALLATAGGMGGGTLPWAGGIAWGLAPWLFRQLDVRQRRYVVGLIATGGGLAIAAAAKGLAVAWERMLTQNTLLIAMLAAVTYLQLVVPEGSARREPEKVQPWRRLAQTAAAIHWIGAVINLSMVVIAAEQLARQAGGRVPEVVARVAARAFLAAALWSPFFAAMAVALTYAPGASFGEVAGYGVGIALFLLLWGVMEVLWSTPPEVLRGIPSYPFEGRQLWLPVLMAVVVAGVHAWHREWAMVAVVNVAAVGVPAVVLVVRAGATEAAARMVRHTVERLPAMRSEFLLFLAAGVLAVGLEGWAPFLAEWLPFESFSWGVAVATLTVMVLLAAAGVHVVVTMTVVSSGFAPLSPDPVALALVFLGAWAIGLALNPFAGVHLLFEGRFALSSVRLAVGNWRYALGGVGAVAVVLALRLGG